MVVAFLIIFLYASSLLYSIALNQQIGYNPYPFGTAIFSIIFQGLLIVLSIWYCGWLFGILVFLFHLLGLFRLTITWVFDIPNVLAKTDAQLLKSMKLQFALLTPMLLITAIFTIMSFFLSEFGALKEIVRQDITYIIVIAIAMTILAILRVIFIKALEKRDREW